MQDVTVFLHVSSYAPVATPIPPSAALTPTPLTFAAQPHQQLAPPLPPPTTVNSNASPSLLPSTTIMSAASLSNSGSSSATVTNGGGLHPSVVDERTGIGGFTSVGTGLGRSKSAAAGPAPLKLKLLATTAGTGTTTDAANASAAALLTGGRDLVRDPPHTALPQSQAFRFGH